MNPLPARTPARLRALGLALPAAVLAAAGACARDVPGSLAIDPDLAAPSAQHPLAGAWSPDCAEAARSGDYLYLIPAQGEGAAEGQYDFAYALPGARPRSRILGDPDYRLPATAPRNAPWLELRSPQGVDAEGRPRGAFVRHHRCGPGRGPAVAAAG